MSTTRRSVLTSGLAVAGTAGLGLTQWAQAYAAAGSVSGAAPGPHGPLGAADDHGVRLPTGFSARLIAVSGQTVAGTQHRWHFQPDGASTFPMPDDGWVYVSNAELDGPAGGAGAIRFDRTGAIVDAYPILSGTTYNCAGGATPWGTWLSCEEFRHGRVWECDPHGRVAAVARPALGLFAHEAAVVDPGTGIVYLTEDDQRGHLYRFVPTVAGDLAAGRLEAAAVSADGFVRWIAVTGKPPRGSDDRTVFARGEGAWFSNGVLYFCTTSDHRVWALDVARSHLSVMYDGALPGPEAPLRQPDNVTVHPTSGDIFVCEDADNLECVLLAHHRGRRIAAPFLRFVGHQGSEVTGAAFTPNGTRLYITSQRGFGPQRHSPGMTFEISGPFRR